METEKSPVKTGKSLNLGEVRDLYAEVSKKTKVELGL